MGRRRSTLQAVAIASVLVPALLAAQTVRGTLTTPASGAPVSGAVVVLVDTTGVVVARALSNEQGEYRLVARTSGSYRVRTLRIGFRPQTSAFVRLLRGEVTDLPISVASIAVSLDTVRVASKSACRAKGDTVVSTYTTWEQVRTALTAAQVTSRSEEISASVVTYERAMNPTFGRIRRQSIAFSPGFRGRAWRSTPLDTVRRFGYVVPDVTGRITYLAPDLDLLMSSEFLEDHCFRLARESNAERLGIDFEPTKERSHVAEISGTVWVDRASAELRTLEYRYVNLSVAETNARPGGEMKFVRFQNGAWAVENWSIRMPVLEETYEALSGTSRTQQKATRLSEIRVAGGELVTVTRGDDTLWRRAPMVLNARVVDSVSERGISGARLLLRGTSLFGKTDGAGRVSIEGVLPGDYSVDVTTPSLDSVEAIHSTEISFTDSKTSAVVLVPNASAVAAQYCGVKAGSSAATGLAMGAVTLRGDSTPPWNLLVTAEWKDGERTQSADARTDALGRYRICGVPLFAAFAVRTELDDTVGTPRSGAFARQSRLARVDIEIAKPTTTVGTLFAGAVMTFFTREPLANAEISLPDIGLTARTNEHGRFRLGVPAGTHKVSVRRIGFSAVESMVTFTADQAITRQFRLIQVATLDTVTVTADRGLGNFYDNMNLGLGKFLTRADLAKQEYRPLAAVMSSLPGTDVFNSGSGAYLRSSRVPRRPPQDTAMDIIGPNRDNYVCVAGNCQCWSQVYVGTMLLNPGRPTPPFNLNDWATHEIEAIEYYPSMSGLPSEYAQRGATCGVFVIHMRRYEEKKKP
jgi:hypothetical protein